MEIRSATKRAAPLPNLTALRFFAAILVLGYHFTWNGFYIPANQWYTPFLTQGFLGVPLFFVLSGFVLAYSHPFVSDRRQFYLARFARVYPLYIFALFILLPLATKIARDANQPVHWYSLPASVLLIQAWMPSAVFFGNPPGWTLSVEAFFYLCFPLLLPFVVRRLDRWLLWVCALWLASLVLPIVADYPLLPGLSEAARANLRDFLFAPPTFLGEFLMGMFAGAQFRRQPRRFTGMAASATTLFSLALVYVSTQVGYHVARNGGVALAFVLMIYVLAGWPSRVLASRWLQLGGEVSYSIYLLQYWVREMFERLPFPLQRNRFRITALFAIALVSYMIIEKPARKLILRVFHARASAKPLPTPASIP